jgi:phthiocerol/phenolphthiocerol synthesis type-I polyketide synthase E
MHNVDLTEVRDEIAIIGMAGRFPGAKDIDEFWRNLRNGVESIAFFTPEELAASGVDPDLLKDPAYVPAAGFLEEADSFDASFFGYSPREAELMDPQQRIMLECAWMAVEHAGYDPEEYDGLIGVFGGVARNTYFIHNVAVYLDLIHSGALYEAMLGSEKDFPATRISYKLNLKGPSINVQTACSTSGVAVHLACQSLLTGECDMALAGGARVQVPLMAGYVYAEGGIPSPDGHCRAFDEKAQGTVYGSGVGFIVLKRLADAIGDGDCIHAVIKGSAINNDGATRAGYTAPSIQGQAAVIEEALAMADVDADAISYIEAHGTGTPIGDPIEIAALTEAFRKTTDRVSLCPIGSVKTNVGHLDAGAAVAGIIKTVLALQHELIPPSLHFERPNLQIDFDNSPFYVNSKLSEWRAGDAPRRAGVSSFGLGGTNAHIILEEAPRIGPSGASRSHQLLLLSAKSDAALAQATKNLAEHLRQHPDVNLTDVAYTLQTGRRAFDHRRMVVCQDVNDTLAALDPVDPRRVATSVLEPLDRDVIFMFSGQGSQYVNMGLGLYKSEPTFRQQVDRCSEILRHHLSLDLREVLYPEDQNLEEAAERLQQTSFAQPALFVIEYALAKLWISWGIHPRAMVGHSIGEYVAACLAGTFSLEQALSLVAARGRLMQALPTGSMLAVLLPEGQIQPYLDGRVCLAVVNSPSLCVVSGEHEAVKGLEKQLSHAGVESRYLHTSHAFHSKMMEPILEQFTEEVGEIRLDAPQIPFVSNVTGTWLTAEEAMDPRYWARHLRQTVRFSDCLHTLFTESHPVFLEVGPGRTLATLARQHPAKPKKLVVLSSARHPKETTSDKAFILNTLGRLWLAGVQVDWSRFYADERRHRVSLPTYPFERKRYWIEPGKQAHSLVRLEPDSVVEPGPDLVSSTHSARENSVAYDGAPRNEVEQSLADIWQGLLGIDNLSIHDNFFEIGGSSLLATRLFAQIAAVFGQRLPLATIFEAPTIEQLASTLDQKVRSATHSSLVRIQDGGSRPPFYCLPGNLGNVFTDLGYLSRYLGLDQPVYGLQDGIGHPSKVEALAAHYIEDIRDGQREGPYYLGGVCLGGVVAFEMAQQLVRQGQDVALLALVEPASLPLPGARSYFDLVAEIWQRLTQHGGDHSRSVAALGWVERIMYVRLKMKLAANFWALKRYFPQVYPGRFHLFLTRESLAESPRLGWGDFATGGVKVHEIPGTHRSITGDYARIQESHMQVLGEKLRLCIDDAMMEER